MPFLFMKDSKDTQKQNSLLNSEYLQIFAKVSVWIVVPVIFSLMVGKFLDNRYNTTPWILCVALGLSFTFSMTAIVKIAKKYMDKDTK
jgi:F0F1-type ATP synthase assembly protein I